MSWFSIKKAFTAHTTAKAGELNENFDGIEAAFNGLILGGRVAGETTSWTAGEGTEKNLTASFALELTQASYVLVTLVADVEIECNTSLSKSYAQVYLNVGGSNQTPYAEIGGQPQFGDLTHIQATISQTYLLSLAAGSHALRMKAKPLSGPLTVKVWADGTGFTYLAVPDPEP